MKRHYSIDMTEGPIIKKLIMFIWPLLASLFLQQLYNAADKAVVGQFAADGKMALAAVGATGAPASLIVNLAVGLSAGASIINANLLGGKRMAELRQNMHTSVLMGLVTGVLICILGICVSEPLLILMGCPENVLETATLYIRIFFVGMPATMVYNFASGILRTHGDSRRPMIILCVSGLFNVAFNLVFVIFLDMSVAGVAWATVIAQTISAAWAVWILFNPKDNYKLSFKELKLPKADVITILRVGIPCSMNSVIFSISNVVLQSTINGYGEGIIAGAAASDSLTNIYYQIPSAFYTATMTFAGQCYGAGRPDRIRKLLFQGGLLGMGVMAVVAIASTILPGVLISIFNSDQTVLEAGSQKLMMVTWGYVLYTFVETVLGCLRGMRKNVIPTMITIFCVCLLRVVWVMFIFPLYTEIWFLYACYMVSYVTSAVVMIPYYFVQIRKVEAGIVLQKQKA